MSNEKWKLFLPPRKLGSLLSGGFLTNFVEARYDLIN